MDTKEHLAEAHIEQKRRALNATIFRLSSANAGLLLLWWLLSAFHANQADVHEFSYILELGAALFVTAIVWGGLLVAACKRTVFWWRHERIERQS